MCSRSISLISGEALNAYYCAAIIVGNQDFLSNLQINVCLVQCGRNSKYKHPELPEFIDT